MHSVLFITQSCAYGATGGGLGGRMLMSMLEGCVGQGLDVAVLGPKTMELPHLQQARVLDFRTRSNKFLTFLRLLSGYQALCGWREHLKLQSLIATQEYDWVFMDVSLFGKLTRFTRRYSQSRCLVHFQNIEYDYFKGQAKALPFWYRLVYWNAAYNERLAAKYAHDISLVNFEEAGRLKSLYDRTFDLCLPVCMHAPVLSQKQPDNQTLQLLFVGAPYYANVQGIRHFIQHILPHTTAHLTVVGRDMATQLADVLTPQVTCLGFVPDLAEAYAKSHVVVAPLYVGAGMKVKIAEAWAYGKKVIATTFAASGYDVSDAQTITLCDDDQLFADAINREPIGDGVCKAARQKFEQLYDTKVVQQKMKAFLESRL